MLQRTRCARAAERNALLTVQQYGQSASGNKPPLAKHSVVQRVRSATAAASPLRGS